MSSPINSNQRLMSELEEKFNPRAIYDAERCGICKKMGTDVFWFSPYSRCAHRVCYLKIKNIEADLVTVIQFIFEKARDRVDAHIRAVGAVQKQLYPDSIETYLKKNGSERLKRIFDTTGLAAVLVPRSKL